MWAKASHVILSGFTISLISVSQCFSEVLHYISLHHAYLGIYCPRENSLHPMVQVYLWSFKLYLLFKPFFVQKMSTSRLRT